MVLEKALSVQNTDSSGVLRPGGNSSIERDRLGSEDVPSEDVISELDEQK